MPELPEVDAARASIHEHFAGKVVTSVKAFQDDKVMEGTNAGEVEQALKGRRLVRPVRKGKHLWFEMEGEERPMPIFHLGMAGAFEIRGASVVKYKRAPHTGDAWPPKWCKVALEFEGGGALAFTDSRRFGKIRVTHKPESTPPISELGLDALNELPHAEALGALLSGSQRAIKAVLLDQTVLCGIGNWLADEVLYQARVHPETRVSALSEGDITRLHFSIQSVLSLSVAARADSSLFPDSWLFHVRWNKVPGSIGGHKISFITVGGRTSAVVPAVQKLTAGSSVKGASVRGGDRGAGPEGASLPRKKVSKRKREGKGTASKRPKKLKKEESEEGEESAEEAHEKKEEVAQEPAQKVSRKDGAMDVANGGPVKSSRRGKGTGPAGGVKAGNAKAAESASPMSSRAGGKRGAKSSANPKTVARAEVVEPKEGSGGDLEKLEKAEAQSGEGGRGTRGQVHAKPRRGAVASEKVPESRKARGRSDIKDAASMWKAEDDLKGAASAAYSPAPPVTDFAVYSVRITRLMSKRLALGE